MQFLDLAPILSQWILCHCPSLKPVPEVLSFFCLCPSFSLIKIGKQTYMDPVTGNIVMTYFHFSFSLSLPQCPYGQANVKDPSKKKWFNSFFYI
uniref:Uncharacterized protein n=1 Tax=Anolis carolinensis TaxID=28377 RepID=A0A803T5M3_ANOCA